jgi:hypothetical protein
MPSPSTSQSGNQRLKARQAAAARLKELRARTDELVESAVGSLVEIQEQEDALAASIESHNAAIAAARAQLGETTEGLVSSGLTVAEIAEILDIDEKVLKAARKANRQKAQATEQSEAT